MPKADDYKQERRTKKYILNNGSTLRVITEVDIHKGRGIQEGPRRVVGCRIDGKGVPTPVAKARAKESGFDILR